MKKKQTYILFDFGFPNSTTFYKDKTYKIKGDVINKILSVIALDYIQKKPNSQGYLEIPSIIFKHAFSNYKPYLNYLITNNIIECDNYFVYKFQDKVSHQALYDLLERTKCMGYRFSWGFSKSANVLKTIYYKINTPKKTTLKAKKQPKKQPSNPVDSPQITIEPETFKRLKRDFRSAQISTLVPRKINYDESKYIDLSRWFRNIVQLHKWKNVSTTFKVKANRIYNNFTFLSSHVRRECISLCGEELNELDIHNSFPLMLAVYAIQQNPELKEDPDFIKYCSWIKSGKFYDRMVELLNIALDCDTTTREKKYQKELAKAIKYYEETGEKLKIIDNRDTPKRKLTRKAVKELFQIYLNGDKKRSPLIKGYGDAFIRKQMNNYFPCIDEIVSNDISKNGMIYYILSEIETKFVIGIIKNLYSVYPEIRILSVHDSLYYPISYQDAVEGVWFRHLNELYNMLPDDNDSEATKVMCSQIEMVFENEDDDDFTDGCKLDSCIEDNQDDDDWDFDEDEDEKMDDDLITSVLESFPDFHPENIKISSGNFHKETERIFADFMNEFNKK